MRVALRAALRSSHGAVGAPMRPLLQACVFGWICMHAKCASLLWSVRDKCLRFTGPVPAFSGHLSCSLALMVC